MAAYMVFGRREYAEPLALLTTVTSAAPPARQDLGVGDGWLELVVMPHDAAIWVIREGHLVLDRAEAAP